MATAAVLDWKERDLCIRLNHHLDGTAEDALAELVMNAIDATHAKTTTSPPPYRIKVAKTSECGAKSASSVCLSLDDDGDGTGIQPKNFLFGPEKKNNPGKLHGRFGLGLKDALAVLMREYEVRIFSLNYDYEFEEKENDLEQKTIHMRYRSHSEKRGGTSVRISPSKSKKKENP